MHTGQFDLVSRPDTSLLSRILNLGNFKSNLTFFDEILQAKAFLGKYLEEFLLVRTLPTNLLQVLCRLIFISKIIAEGNTGHRTFFEEDFSINEFKGTPVYI